MATVSQLPAHSHHPSLTYNSFSDSLEDPTINVTNFLTNLTLQHNAPSLKDRINIPKEQSLLTRLKEALEPYFGLELDSDNMLHLQEIINPFLQEWYDLLEKDPEHHSLAYTLLKTTVTEMLSLKTSPLLPRNLFSIAASFMSSPITLEQKLTSGTFGNQVMLKHEDGSQYVVKTARTSFDDIPDLKRDCISYLKGEAKDQFELEKAILLTLAAHPNIISCYGITSTEGSLGIILEYAELGDLFDLLTDKKIPSLLHAANIARELASGLLYLHQSNIVHRDIKPENIVLSSEFIPKIIDFGLAAIIDPKNPDSMTGSIAGTPQYLSPEMEIYIKGGIKRKLIGKELRPVTPKSDVWSYGCVIVDLLGNRGGFLTTVANHFNMTSIKSSLAIQKLFMLTTQQDFSAALDFCEYYVSTFYGPDVLSDPYNQLLYENMLEIAHKCLTLDYQARISSQELLATK